MAKLVWDAIGKHYYETGVDHVVLYRLDANNAYSNGYAWNGVSSISESPSGGDANPIWADNIKYLNLRAAEEYGSTIECYTYPDEFAECNGEGQPASGIAIGQQTRKTFGLSYRTIVGNDAQGNDLGYKLHLVYGCTASPSEKSYSTVNDSPEAGTFSFEISTVPVAIPGYKNTAILTIDSTKVAKASMTALEALLYGTDAGSGATATDPQLPSPETVLTTLGLTYSEQTGQWSA